MNLEQQAAFNKLWIEHWPKCRRQEKKKALKYWEKISPELYNEIYAAVDLQKQQPAWQKEDCAFIPYLWRWLRDERWTDEVTLPAAKASAPIGGAVDRVMEKLKTPGAYMPDDAAIRPALVSVLTGMKTNWPGLRAMLKDDPTIEPSIRAELEKACHEQKENR